MKELLKEKLPPNVWSFLKQLASRVLRIWYRIINIVASLILALLRLLPKRLLVEVKERLSITVKMDYARSDIYLYSDSVTEYVVRTNSSRKEPETVQWIETYVKPGDIFFDIGANTGSYSFIADCHTRGLAKIYSFEPSFSTYAQLVRNVNLNSCQERIVPLCIALSDETYLGVLNYSSLAPGAALHALGLPINNLGEAFKPVFKQPVISYRIDDFIKMFRMSPPTHIKLDVDGIELKVLKGAVETLQYPGLRSVLVEIEPSLETSEQIVGFLGLYGFHTHIIKSHGRSESSTCNYIFTRD
ncbi:MAG: FkbM family methyltransferase [Anaerolineales bacterium]|nr:FkbM family methyltransferase [Anaerolineales bacterium]